MKHIKAITIKKSMFPMILATVLIFCLSSVSAVTYADVDVNKTDTWGTTGGTYGNIAEGWNVTTNGTIIIYNMTVRGFADWQIIQDKDRNVLYNVPYGTNFGGVNGVTLSPGNYYFLTNTTSTSAHPPVVGITFPRQYAPFNISGSIDNGGTQTTSNNWNLQTVTYSRIETVESPISVLLLIPTDNSRNSVISLNFTANYTTSSFNFTNATYYIWNSTYDIFNQTTKEISGNTTNTTTITPQSFSFGTYYWNVLTCGINFSGTNKCYFAPTNYTLYVGATISNNSYNLTTYDTKSESFAINASVLSTTSVYSANFIYNNISYNADLTNFGSGVYSLSKTIDIPIVNAPTNKTFYWKLNYDSGGFITETFGPFNQTVDPSNISICGNPYPTLGINFTTYNETDLAALTTTFKGTFYWYLGSGTVKKNISFSPANANNYKFCISPNATFTIQPTIKLTAPGFLDRTYTSPLFQISNNSITEKFLYLLDSAIGRTVITEFRDTTLIPLSGYYLKLLRYYPNTDKYLAVQEDKTDNFGVVVADLIENTVKYRFNYYDINGTLIKETTNDVTIACRSTICVLTFLKDVPITDFDRFKNISNYEYTLTFNNVTNEFIYTWNDNSGASPHHRLFVERILANGTTTVCNLSSTDLAGTIKCAVGDSYASYNAQAFRYASPERRIGLLQVKIGDISGKFGIEGLIWSFILLMTFIAVGIWYPPAGIALYVVGFIILGITGIIYANPAIFVAEAALGIIFVWAWRG